ncbi:PRC-barrel domain-containing protein [Streptomyces sp. NPDC006879]|uniref:PRC-barrel domain-containing protein n=1 Tax=Streptomyces sp. NPDC006879 TaxID=3364767 RepID=UPI00367F22FD
MLFSQTTGRPVIALVTAETLATVAGLTIAAAPARVASIRLKSHGAGTLLSWDRIQAFGPDAVTVRSAEKIQSEKDLADSLKGGLHDPIGKRILTEAGEDLGPLDDIEFDESTGQITRLITVSREIPGEQLLGSGSYAVVVSAP